MLTATVLLKNGREWRNRNIQKPVRQLIGAQKALLFGKRIPASVAIDGSGRSLSMRVPFDSRPTLAGSAHAAVAQVGIDDLFAPHQLHPARRSEVGAEGNRCGPVPAAQAKPKATDDGTNQ